MHQGRPSAEDATCHSGLYVHVMGRSARRRQLPTRAGDILEPTYHIVFSPAKIHCVKATGSSATALKASPLTSLFLFCLLLDVPPKVTKVNKFSYAISRPSTLYV